MVAIGRYVEKICQNVVKSKNLESAVYYLQHPSPQFIKNHEQWIEIAEQNLKQKSDLFKLLTTWLHKISFYLKIIIFANWISLVLLLNDMFVSKSFFKNQ